MILDSDLDRLMGVSNFAIIRPLLFLVLLLEGPTGRAQVKLGGCGILYVCKANRVSAVSIIDVVDRSNAGRLCSQFGFQAYPIFSVTRRLHARKSYRNIGFWGWEIGNKVRNIVWDFVYGGDRMHSEFVPGLDVVGCRRRLLVESLQGGKYSWLFIGVSEPDLQVGLVRWSDFDL